MYLLWILLVVYAYHQFLINRDRQESSTLESWIVVYFVVMNYHSETVRSYSTFLLCLSLISRILCSIWLVCGGYQAAVRGFSSIAFGFLLSLLLSLLPEMMVEHLDLVVIIVGLGYAIGVYQREDISLLIREISRLLGNIRESGIIKQGNDWSQLAFQFLTGSGCVVDQTHRRATVKIFSVEGRQSLFLPYLMVEGEYNIIATGVREGNTSTPIPFIKQSGLTQTTIVGLPVRPSDLGFHRVVIDLETRTERRQLVFYGDEIITFSPPSFPRENKAESLPEGQE